MKVLVFFNFLWAHYAGAVFSELHTLCEKENIEIEFVHLATTSSERVLIGSADTSFHQYPYSVLFDGPLDQIPQLPLARAMLRVLWSSNADVVLLPGYDRLSYWILLLACVVLRKRRILRLDSTEMDHQRTFSKEFVKKLFVKFCDGGFAYGQRSAEYLQALGMPATRIVAGCQSIPQEQIESWADHSIVMPDWSVTERANSLVFLFVGRLAPEKDVGTLLHAFDRLAQNDARIVLNVVGGGPDAMALRLLADTLSSAKRIQFLGPLPLKEVIKQYQQAYAFVLPSISEPWGLVVNEAMFMKCPVVISDRCGCGPELVSDGRTGFTFKAGDEDDLVGALSLMLSAIGQREEMGEAARARSMYYSPLRAAQMMLGGFHRFGSPNGQANGVEVIYHFFPHYRQGVVRALGSSTKYAYTFRGAANEIQEGIRAISNWENLDFRDSPFRLYGRLMVQWAAVSTALSSSARHFIFLSNPYFLTTWLAALIVRLRRRKVYFWGHGWLHSQVGFRLTIRKIFYMLAHEHFLYGEKARQIGVTQGFALDQLHVVGNSLNYEEMKIVRENLAKDARARGRALLGISAEAGVVICVARLTKLCNFDLMIEALAILKAQGREVVALLVGAGPEREFLEQKARLLAVEVKFLGEIYEETEIANLLTASDVTVSPGKVGLTCIQSLTYGVPVISHDRWEMQMPEAEAIIPGRTGDFFEYGDVYSLSDAIAVWLEKMKADEQRSTVRKACVDVIEARFTPTFQREVIELALNENKRR